jgi:hypothetical protein
VPDKYFSVHPQVSARIASLNGVQVREDLLYTNDKGEEKKSIRKRAEKAIDKLQGILQKVIGPDEAVLFVARCQSPVSAFEQLTMGWYVYYVSQTVLVFTNRRLLQFQVKRDGSWKRGLRSLQWGDVEQGQVKGWLNRTLEFKHRTGKKETYWRLGGGDARKIKVLLESVFSAGARESTAAQGMVSLCPNCLNPLTPGVYKCNACALVFKDERTMVRRSLLIPGGGYYYAGHRFLGIGAFIAEAYLLLLTVVPLYLALTTPRRPSGADQGINSPTVMLTVAVFYGGILAIEKWLTVRHCRRLIRDFIPVEQDAR